MTAKKTKWEIVVLTGIQGHDALCVVKICLYACMHACISIQPRHVSSACMKGEGVLHVMCLMVSPEKKRDRGRVEPGVQEELVDPTTLSKGAGTKNF